jgi:hypothetical protein
MFTQKNSRQLKKLLLLSVGTTAALTAQLLIASPAKAQETTCEYEGTTYQVGDTVGPLLCMPDGTWQLNG